MRPYSSYSSRTRPPYPVVVDTSLLILRLVLGLVFMGHGAQKLFGWFGGRGWDGTVGQMEGMGFQPPVLWAALAGGGEFFGGLMVLLGLAAEVGAFAILATMIVAIWKVTFKNGFFIQNDGYEYNLLIIAVCLAIIISGPGQWALWRLRK